MTEYQNSLDTAGIPLLEEAESPVQEYLQRQQQQLEHLTEEVTQIMAHLRPQST